MSQTYDGSTLHKNLGEGMEFFHHPLSRLPDEVDSSFHYQFSLSIPRQYMNTVYSNNVQGIS